MTTKLLANQLQSILADPVEGFTVELANESSLYEWRVYIEGPRETCYEGGVFQLSLNFPKDYPMNPPVLKFISDFWHPNVYVDGKVCMSILHPPGDDAMSGELARERWLPTQSVTTIVLSLLSLLNDPNCSSPANVDASVEWRKNRSGYIQKCKKLVERANREKPAHVVIPHPDTDETEHKRIVQKWKEMNKGMDYDEFYEHNEEESESEEENGSESDEENEEEDDTSEIDSEGDGVAKKAEKNKKKENDAPITTTTSTPPSQPLVPSSSAEPVAASSSSPAVAPPPLSATPVIPSSSTSSLPTVSPALSNSPSNPPAVAPANESSEREERGKRVEDKASSSRKAKEEISIEPSSSSSPSSSAISSSAPSSSNNNNNTDPPQASPRGKKSKKAKKKKCIIM